MGGEGGEGGKGGEGGEGVTSENESWNQDCCSSIKSREVASHHHTLLYPSQIQISNV